MRAVPLFGAGLAVLVTGASVASAQPFTSVVSPDIAAHVSFSTGVTWVDYDHDGDLDLFVVTGFAASNNNVLYRNDGGDTFVRVLGVPLVSDAAESVCSTWADTDNDGHIDCFVSNLVSAGGMYYKGQGGGDLALDTISGLAGTGLKGTGAAWGDYDNDGFVDLLIAALFGQGGITTPNRLFHNDGDGTFTEISGVPPATLFDSCHHPTWSDYDNDGDQDLFVASGGPGFTKRDQLYRNQLVETGTANFTAITTGPIATDFRDSQVLSWVDYDNDGDLDMYAVNYSSVPNQLYRNDGGVFTKLMLAGIATDLGAAHGVVWGDFDNDADQDCYVARDLGQSNRYYRNNADGTFTSITTGAFVNEARSNYGAAAGDYDQDGDLDLFLPTARSEGASLLFRNDLAAGNHWLVVRCEGTLSNRSAIGAKVRVRAVIGGTPRWQRREVSAGTSYGGPNALEAHFGLADAGMADSVRVEWPSGLVDMLANVAADQRLDVVENTTTAVLGAVVGTTASASGVRVEWSLAGFDARDVIVQRAESDADWMDHGRAEVGARGIAVFDDSDVQAGRRYGYRLWIDAAPGPQALGETWITLPEAGAPFGISRLWPNPGPGAVQVQFELESNADAVLDVFDVAGRRVATQSLASPAIGRHVRRAWNGEILANGVYYLRLQQAGRIASARLVIAR